MNAADYERLEMQVIELCKDLLPLDLVGALEFQDVSILKATASDRMITVHRVVVALRGAQARADDLRKVIVDEEREKREQLVREGMEKEFQDRMTQIEQAGE